MYLLPTMKKLKLKIKIISPLMKLFFAIVKAMDRIVIVLKVNLALKGLY
jgi:hypothetical protein